MNSLRELFQQFGNLLRWWVVVAPWEEAVRVRLGKNVQVLGAGVHLRIPLADRYFVQSIRRRMCSVSTQTVTTRDGKTVTINGALGYRIDDLGTLYNTLHHAQDTIESEAQAAVARYMASHDFEDAAPEKVEAHVASSLRLEEYGLGDVEYCVTDYAAVRTYRLIQGEPKAWTSGDSLRTDIEDTYTP